jgi:1-deoxy-D-xylulose-5-phosphate reductoisomerase
MMKNISVLGSTGSIGRNVLKIAEMFPERLTILALAAGRNIELLTEQIRQFAPKLAVVLDETYAKRLIARLPSGLSTEILWGESGYRAAATLDGADGVVSAIVGAAGLLPTLAAIEAGKEIALANKETLVMAGDLVMQRAAEKGVRILPIDSEHSAIFQCMQGQRTADFAKILLTASGGPFRTRPFDTFSTITLQDALNHPTWQMGKKISIDSATLMNKGLEIIEARHLFNISERQIEVVIHPESVVHSMVAYQDGSIIAQMGIPDMKGAIAYALSYPERLPLKLPSLDFAVLGSLTFENPDFNKFPCLNLAYQACRKGGTLPAVMNAANESCVNAFLDERISFVHIPAIIRRVMAQHDSMDHPALPDILTADQWARQQVESFISTQSFC